MKKLLRPKYLPLYVLLCGVLGFVVRLLTLGSGADSLGLYAPKPLEWGLLWLITALCVLLILIIITPLKKPGQYADHFSASTSAAVGHGFAAAGLILTGFRASGEPSTIYSLLMSVLALAAALGMCLAAVARYRGNRQPFWAYLVTALFLGLRTFDRCRGWSTVPQTGLYLFPFLASACIMLALFQLASLQADYGNRRVSLFFSLFGVYLSMVALAHTDEVVFYMCMAVFLLTNLCSLRFFKKPPVTATAPEAAPEKATDPTEMSYDELMDWLKNG